MLVDGKIRVSRLALVNAVMFDSWPVPGVARFRDPDVAAATTTEDVLVARRKSVVTALARVATEAEIAEYLDPWADPRVARSWLALAGAAYSRYTMDIVPALRASAIPKLLVWGKTTAFSGSITRNALSRRFRIPRSFVSLRRDTSRWKTTRKPLHAL
ncbi:hypothetical protein CS8_037250 [Cupriavidus sp. 8B]